MGTLTAGKSPSPNGADDALNTLIRLQSQELIRVHDAAVVSWPPDRNKPRMHECAHLRRGPRPGGLGVPRLDWRDHPHQPVAGGGSPAARRIRRRLTKTRASRPSAAQTTSSSACKLAGGRGAERRDGWKTRCAREARVTSYFWATPSLPRGPSPVSRVTHLGEMPPSARHEAGARCRLRPRHRRRCGSSR
jgi:hypothetical protein